MSNELGNTPADKNYKPSGISKAVEAANEIYKDGIELFGRRDKNDNLIIHPETMVGILRNACQRGYEQAEKDLALTWKDVQLLYIITGQYESEINKNLEVFPSSSQEMFEEILWRFKEAKR